MISIVTIYGAYLQIHGKPLSICAGWHGVTCKGDAEEEAILQNWDAAAVVVERLKQESAEGRCARVQHTVAAAYFDCSFILFIIAKPMINVPQSAHVLKYSSIGGPLICGGGKPINSDVSGSHVIFIWICKTMGGTLRLIWHVCAFNQFLCSCVRGRRVRGRWEGVKQSGLRSHERPRRKLNHSFSNDVFEFSWLMST